MFRPMPKTHPFRSDKLRHLANEVPYCMGCGASNEGQVVLAHSNHLEDGKGMGIKAHDVPCYACNACHDIIDGRTPGHTPEEQDLLRLKITYNSVVWCLQNKALKVA